MEINRLSIFTGIALILLGTGFYFATGSYSATAVIPFIYGLAFSGLGYLGKKIESLQTHTAYATLLLGVFALFSTLNGFISMYQLFQGVPVEKSTAAIAQGAMFIACFLFLYFGIRSLLRNRQTTE